jgi:hypothetical protein
MTDSSTQTFTAAQLREHLKRDEVAELHPHAGLVDDDRVLALLNHYATAFRAADDPDLPERVEDLTLYQEVLMNAATETTTEAVQSGAVSPMQFSVGFVENSDDRQTGLTRILEEMRYEAFIGLVKGSPGTGKTATAINLAHAHAIHNGAEIATNIASWEAAHYHVETYGELVDVLADTSGRVLMVLDEADNHLTGRGGDASKAAELAKKLKLVRKDQGDVLFIGQTNKGLHPELRQLLSLVIEKPSRRDKGRANVFRELTNSGPNDQLMTVKGLTDARFEYQTYEESTWSWQGLDDEDSEEAPDPDAVRKREHVATVLRAVQPWDEDSGMTHSDAAELVPWSASWVSTRASDWKDGEYRDLVSAPGGESA